EIAASLGSDRFFREIEVAAQLQHPHILPLLDSGEAGGFYYYVMPFVEGESLRERLARHGELPVHEAVKILIEVVDALIYAHSRGVVHRDIKPDNVMLSGRHALVTDFGVAKAVSEATGRQQITTAGVALGTPSYMAPEQATADPHLDHRVDIYAVGIMAYEMLAGTTPFHGRTPQELLAAQVTQVPDPITTRRFAVPPGLGAVIMKCLEKRPADRWQSAEELWNQFEVLATSSAGITPTQTRPTAPIGPTKQFPRWLAWAMGGALVAGGALALALVQRQPATVILGKRVAVATAPEWEAWPSLSPDGQMVFYTVLAPSGNKLFAQQVDGGRPIPLTADMPGSQAVGTLSPDGNRLLFLGNDGLYVMPALGGQARRVVPTPSRDLSAAQQFFVLGWGGWSPDGQRIVYPNEDTLFIQSISDSDRTALTTGVDLHSPAWSPDGRWVAFVEGNPMFHFSGNIASSAIRVIPAAGGKVSTVADATSLNTSPVWLSGRLTLLFISDREGGRDIYEVSLKKDGTPSAAPVRITTGLNPAQLSVSADGGKLAWSVFTENSNIWSLQIPARDSVPLSRAQSVTTGSQNIENVSVSPDGAWLYYDSDRSGNMDIWRLPLAGGPPEQLTTDPAGDFSPSPSPDGRTVAFHSLRTGKRDIFIMPAAGGPATQVSHRPGTNMAPVWSPDGRELFWIDLSKPESLAWRARRSDSAGWESATPAMFGTTLARPNWSPNGEWASLATLGGTEVLNLRTGQRRAPRMVCCFHGWSQDSRILYSAGLDSSGRFVIQAVSLPDGNPRVVAYADNPLSQSWRLGFAVRGDRFYFPLIERKADVWVGEAETK
ncbi:MAG TPA: protein kinase, partial [Gemmatimonadales bacterium]|nr:protein kinase [Gemmatimonadales bacterium]